MLVGVVGGMADQPLPLMLAAGTIVFANGVALCRPGRVRILGSGDSRAATQIVVSEPLKTAGCCCVMQCNAPRPRMKSPQ